MSFKKPRLLCFLLLMIFSLTIATAGVYNCSYTQGRILAKFKDGSPDDNKIGNLKTAAGYKMMRNVFRSAVKDRFGLDRIYSFDCPGKEINRLVDIFNKSGLFEYVEPDYVAHGCAEKVFIPNDQYFYRQWYLNNDGTYNMAGMINPKADADIDMPEAWEIEKGDSSVIIAILDSGCKMDHPELAGHFWKNPGEIPGNGIDDDNDGYIDDVYGWDFVNNDNDPTDDNGHGVGIAGIIAASGNNSIGFSGINLNAKIMIIKVSNNKHESSRTNVAKGIEYAIQHKAKIINMSFAANTPSETERTAVLKAYDAGIIMCGGSGNNNDSTVYYPAAYEQVISVGGTGPDDKRWIDSSTSGSNYGTRLDLVAPGSFIFQLDTASTDKYNMYGTGTSASTAIVTGVVSLLLSQNLSLTPEQVRTILKESADDQVGDPKEDTPGWDKYYGAGRLNAFKALQRVSSVKRPQPLTVAVNCRPSNFLYIQNYGKRPDFEANVFSLTGRKIGKVGNGAVLPLAGGLYLEKAGDRR